MKAPHKRVHLGTQPRASTAATLDPCRGARLGPLWHVDQGVKQVARRRVIEASTRPSAHTGRPFIVAARQQSFSDWTSFAADGQDTIVLSMVTGHGRARPFCPDGGVPR